MLAVCSGNTAIIAVKQGAGISVFCGCTAQRFAQCLRLSGCHFDSPAIARSLPLYCRGVTL